MIIALDLGGSRLKAGRLDDDGRLQDIRSLPAPPPGRSADRHESDAVEYLKRAERLLSHFPRPASLAISCQRSSFLLWDAHTGRALTPLIGWQDLRARDVSLPRQQLHWLQQRTGLRLTPYYLAPKAAWLLARHPDWRIKLQRRDWLLGTLDSFLLWHWSAGACHQMDASMAARSLLMDIHSGQWSEQLCAMFDLPMAMLPEIVASAGLQVPLGKGLTLTTMLADQSAAALAAIGDDHTSVLINLGTGGFLLCRPEAERGMLPGYLQTLLYRSRIGASPIALEATLNGLAPALQGYPVAACQFDQLAADAELYCSTESTGIGAPYFCGSSGVQCSTPWHDLTPERAAAVLIEGIVFRVCLTLQAFATGCGSQRALIAGGLTRLPALAQGLAACSPLPLARLLETEASLLGAAQLASGRDLSVAAHETIAQPESCQPLRDKYQRWRHWFEHQLIADF